jgi:sugar lactone lactonase YvrE
MGKGAEAGAGAIYRYYKGELRLLFPNLTIPNAICFSPDGRTAYFTDTAKQIVNHVPLDAAGWPTGPAQAFIDLRASDENPDGAVVDAAGNIWLALWGAGQIAVFDAQGQRSRSIALAAPHATCPAFGGDDLTTLYCTSATQGMAADALAAHPDAGKVFALDAAALGLSEPQVML